MGWFDGILGGAAAPQQGGVLSGVSVQPPPKWATGLGMFGSALQDAGSSLSGRGGTNHLSDFTTKNRGLLAQQQLMSALSSTDPKVRAQGYTTAAMMGIDTKPIQQQQAAQQAPDFLKSLSAHDVNVAPVSAQLPNGQTVDGGGFNFNAPAMTLPEAVQAAPYETQQQYAPEVIKQQMEMQQKAVHTLSPQELQAKYGMDPNTLPPGTVPQEDAFGHVTFVKGGDLKSQGAMDQALQGKIAEAQKVPMTAAQRASNGIATANLGLSQQRLAFEKEHSAVDPKAVDLGVQYFLQYGKLPPTARNPAMQGAIMAAASDRLSAQGKTMQDVIQTAQTNTAAGATVTAFDKGKQGDTVRSLNVSVQHLDTLRELGKALQNGDINMLNAARQKFQEAFGVAAPTNWDTAKAIVADEVAKGVIGGQTAQSDRETLAATLKNSRSPAQAEGAIGTFQDLLGGQLRGLRQQYKSSTGRGDFNNKLFPETVRRLDPQGGSPSTANLPRIQAPGAIHPPDINALLKKYGAH